MQDADTRRQQRSFWISATPNRNTTAVESHVSFGTRSREGRHTVHAGRTDRGEARGTSLVAAYKKEAGPLSQRELSIPVNPHPRIPSISAAMYMHIHAASPRFSLFGFFIYIYLLALSLDFVPIQLCLFIRFFVYSFIQLPMSLHSVHLSLYSGLFLCSS